MRHIFGNRCGIFASQGPFLICGRPFGSSGRSFWSPGGSFWKPRGSFWSPGGSFWFPLALLCLSLSSIWWPLLWFFDPSAPFCQHCATFVIHFGSQGSLLGDFGAQFRWRMYVWHNENCGFLHMTATVGFVRCLSLFWLFGIPLRPRRASRVLIWPTCTRQGRPGWGHINSLTIPLTFFDAPVIPLDFSVGAMGLLFGTQVLHFGSTWVYFASSRFICVQPRKVWIHFHRF